VCCLTVTYIKFFPISSFVKIHCFTWHYFHGPQMKIYIYIHKHKNKTWLVEPPNSVSLYPQMQISFTTQLATAATAICASRKCYIPYKTQIGKNIQMPHLHELQCVCTSMHAVDTHKHADTSHTTSTVLLILFNHSRMIEWHTACLSDNNIYQVKQFLYRPGSRSLRLPD
jgi:hypothetical protein